MAPIPRILDLVCWDFLLEVFCLTFINEVYFSIMFNLEIFFNEVFAPYYSKLREVGSRSGLILVCEKIPEVVFDLP